MLERRTLSDAEIEMALDKLRLSMKNEMGQYFICSLAPTSGHPDANAILVSAFCANVELFRVVFANLVKQMDEDRRMSVREFFNDITNLARECRDIAAGA